MIQYGAKLDIDKSYLWSARWPDTATVPGDETILIALRFVDNDDVAMVSIQKRDDRTVYGSYTPKIGLTSANVYMPLYMLGATAQNLTKASWWAGLTLKIQSWIQGSTIGDPKTQVRGELVPSSKYVWLAYWPGAVPSSSGIVDALQSVGNGSASVLHSVTHVALGSYSPGEPVNDEQVREALANVGAKIVKVHSAADFPFPDWALDAGEKLQNIEMPDPSVAIEWSKLALLGVGLFALSKVGGK